MARCTVAALALLAAASPLRAGAQSPWTARWSDAQPEPQARYVASSSRAAADGPQARAEPSPAAAAGCKLFARDAGTTPSEECMRCHGRQTHPVDLDYAATAARQPMGLRPPAEAVRRGVFLPEGQLRCVTCHDARSPWKDRIALPPGARVSPAVNPRDGRTYLRPAPSAPLAAGAAVTPTPLCKACHTMGD